MTAIFETRSSGTSCRIAKGFVAPGFEAVRAEFERNFTERGELGAACAAYCRGEKVVDLWGGYRDRKLRAPWEEDTLVLVFSTTKGLAAMTMAQAHSRGLIDFDERVAFYWPEFGQKGKAAITVRELLAHQAGLPAVDRPLAPEILSDFDALAHLLASLKPRWAPGTRQGYHAFTLGFYESELLRRVDPKKRSLGIYFKDEIAAPLGIEFYIGTPGDVPESRLAPIRSFRPWEMALHAGEMPLAMVLSVLVPWSLTARSLNPLRLKDPADLEKAPLRALQIPSGNGIGQVRAIARAYGAFASGGAALGLGRETLDELAAPWRPPTLGARDLILRVEARFALGFTKPSPVFPFAGERSFGSAGAGGSFGFADPDAELGYAYAPNRMGFRMFDDPREKALRLSVYACLAALKTRGPRG